MLGDITQAKNVYIVKELGTEGGFSMKNIDMSTLSLEVAAYIRSLEKTGELQVTDGSDGEIVVTLDAGLKQVKYSFTEE